MERRAWRQGGQIGTEQLGKLAGKGGNQRASVDMIMGASRDGHGRARTRQRTRTGTGVPGLGRGKQAGRQAGMQGRQGRQAGMQGRQGRQAGMQGFGGGKRGQSDGWRMGTVPWLFAY